MEDVISHSLEIIENYPDPDFPPPLVIHAPTLDGATIRALANYMLDLVETRYQMEGEYLLYARPIVLDIGAAQSLNERVIWSLIIEALPDAADFVISYVDKHIEPHVELQFTNCTDVVGEAALYAFFDSFVDNRPRLSYYSAPETCRRDTLRVVDCFIRFLRHCDLDHEVYQHAYIEKVLDYLRMEEDYSRYVELLILRLTSGQVNLDSNFPDVGYYLTQFRASEGEGILKALVDHYLASEGDAALDQIMKVCALFYGEEEDLVRDVMSYCEKVLQISIAFPPDDWDLKLHRTRRNLELQDIYRDSRSPSSWGWRPPPIRTGFHTYFPETGEWKRQILPGQHG